MFICAFQRSGAPLHVADLRRPGVLRLGWERTNAALIEEGPLVAAVRSGPGLIRPLVARYRHLVAVGDVRLDNRERITALAGCARRVGDLDLALRAIDAQGEKAIPALLGDFAFVLWDARAQKLLAVRDAFGVKPLHLRVTNDLLLFASRADVLAVGERYDTDYIAEFLTGMIRNGEGRTIWSGVREVPTGGCVVQRGTIARTSTYWTPDSFEPELEADERECADRFLDLFRDAVRSRMGAAGTTWAQLSGGLDSSSVVAMAQSGVAENGLAGTLTIVDTLGAGDERRYVDRVLRRYDLPNERVIDSWAWQDGGEPPPALDGPSPLYPFFTRDRRALDLVRQAGARVVLSGFGSDHYLLGNYNYIADAAARGQISHAARELATLAIGTRQSFWKLARAHVVGPLVRASLGRRVEPDLPDWIAPDFAQSADLASRLSAATATAGPPGRMFSTRTARDVRGVTAGIDRWAYESDVEIRYPFLHRPLVEACLRMPPRMRIRPSGTKWVLRRAMRGLLPDEVRLRRTKGYIDARILWSLNHERLRVDRLLRDPILSQLGCVEGDALRLEVERARAGKSANRGMLIRALSLETWLAVRNGRWATMSGAARSAA